MSLQVATAVALAWLIGVTILQRRVKLPRSLPDPRRGEHLVSVIVPARNEALNIERCLRGLCDSNYPSFEVIVVDDQSTDETGDLARSVPKGRAQRVVVLSGEGLPEGWLGKPWACHQGSRAARGDLLLFTDADTYHGPDLLERAVAALTDEAADAVTVVGRQEMETFWERLVQPQVFFGMFQVFSNLQDGFDRNRWRRAIANGQFLLFRRDSYDRLGGHEAVKGEVVEDLRLAQILVRDGYTLVVREAFGALATRMYRSLGGLVEGWSKNTALGARYTGGPWGSVLMFAGALVGAPILWLGPPVLALAGAVGAVSAPATALGVTATALNAGMWAVVSRSLGAPAVYGLLYPLGSAVAWFIVFRSFLRGTRVEWKGRQYRVEAPAA